MSPKKLWMYLSVFIVTATLLLTAMLGLAAALIYPDLPSLEALTNYQPKLPLRVYSEDGYLLAEYGEERRAFLERARTAVVALRDV